MMKVKIALFVLVALFLTYCNNQPKKHKTFTVQQVHKIIIKDVNIQILDVRTPEEYMEGHLEKAINKNWYDSNFSNKINELDKTKPVLIYCEAGGRSETAAQKLTELGFKNVIQLKGGIEDWNRAGFTTIK